MGRGFIKILFESGIPSFAIIRDDFFKQTGLHISLNAELSVSTLTDSAAQTIFLLQQDVTEFLRLKQEYSNVIKSSSQTDDYESTAAYRDNVYKPSIGAINHIKNITLQIPDFYGIEFYIESNTMEIIAYIDQYYGIESLNKILLDLGGQHINYDGSLSRNYPAHWRRLRKWAEYRWYNRPRK